jgi:succinyl-CoA synthetase alpha subunit
VPVDDERRLKQMARERNLLVMGPDCGTSIVNGVGLGFANVVRRGTIGAIGPSGTGLQEFTCLVHHAGLGISHAIGTGSHDLSDDVGGITTLMALDRLEADLATEVIAIIAKPAGPRSRALLVERLEACTKPVVACLLGSPPGEGGGRIAWAGTIDAAAHSATELGRGAGRPEAAAPSRVDHPPAGKIRDGWAADQRYVRGLFAGGTLCYQSQQMLQEAGLTALSNVPLDPKDLLGPFEPSREHTLIDMGDEVFTLGRLHPMIDGSLRRQRIAAESVDPSVAILLLDSSWATTPPLILWATSWRRSRRGDGRGRRRLGR